MDTNTIYHVLAATMSGDNATRNAAETELAKLAATPGFLHGLLQVTGNAEIPTGPRLSAAIAFKRAVEQHWCYLDAAHAVSQGSSGDVRSRYSPEERAEIRAQLMPVAVQQPTLPLINALVDAIVVIFRHDFPDHWDCWVSQMTSFMTSGHSHTTLVALLIFAAICKMYEIDTRKAQLIFKPVVEVLSPALLQIAQYAAEHIATDEGGHCLRLTLKAFYSLTHGSFEVHTCLLDSDMFVAWCLVASQAMVLVPLEPQPASSDAKEKNIWWKVKKWGVKVFYRLAGEWGQPELIDDAATKQIAQLFNRAVAPEACKQLLQMLHDWQEGSGVFISQRLLFYGLHFLQSCLDFSSCWKAALKDNMAFLLQQVVFSLFRISEDELATVEADPYEYMRMNSESAFSSSSPRKSAELLLWAALEVRKSTTVPILDTMIQQGLALYEGQAPEARDPYFKEALLYLLQDLHNWLATDKQRKQFIGDMLQRHVTPELKSHFPFLRSRAVAVWARYADVKLKDPRIMEEALLHVYELVRDPVLVVKLTAGGSIAAFLARSKRARKLMRPHMMELLVSLFGCLDELGMDEVVRTVGVMCDAYYDELPKIALPLVEKLVGLWISSLPDADDNDVDDEGAGALFGDGLLSTIQTIIYQLMESQATATLLEISPYIWSLCESLSRTEGPTLEYLDSAFEIYGDMLVALSEKVSEIPEVWTLYLRMLNLYTNCALDYAKCLLYPLDCLCVYATARMAAECDPTTGQDNAMCMFKAAEFTEEHADEDSRGTFIRMLVSLLHHCRGTVDRVVPHIVALYAKCASNAHTKYLRSQAYTVLCACLMYNPEITVRTLLETGLLTSAFTSLIEGTAANYYKKSLDCKISMLGLTNLLKSVPLGTMPPELAVFVPQFITVICSLQVQYETLLMHEDKLRKEHKEMEDDFDDDDDLPDFRGDDAGDDPGSDYDFDDDDAADTADDEAGGDIGDEADYVKEADRVHAAAVKERQNETEEQRKARLDALLEEGDTGDNIPSENTPLDHVEHLLWLQDAVNVVMSQPGAEHLHAAVDPVCQSALAALLAKANEMRCAGCEAGELGPAPPEPPAEP